MPSHSVTPISRKPTKAKSSTPALIGDAHMLTKAARGHVMSARLRRAAAAVRISSLMLLLPQPIRVLGIAQEAALAAGEVMYARFKGANLFYRWHSGTLKRLAL